MQYVIYLATACNKFWFTFQFKAEEKDAFPMQTWCILSFSTSLDVDVYIG